MKWFFWSNFYLIHENTLTLLAFDIERSDEQQNYNWY